MSKAKGSAIKSVDLGWDDGGTSLQGLLERSISDNPTGRTEQSPGDLPIDLIDHNPYQARQAFSPTSLQELADSIREHGVIEPIIVRPVGDRYEIVAGERRYRAAHIAELTRIPVRVMALDDTQAAIVTTLENLQREDLDIEDEARQFAFVLEKTGMSQRALARKLGIDHRYVMRRIKLLERPDLIQAYRDGRLKMHDAVALVDLPLDELDSALDSGGSGERGEQGGVGETGPRGTSVTGAGEDWDPEELDLVEREDMPGFIVARSGRPGNSTQFGPPGTSARGSERGNGRTRFKWRPVQQFYTWVGRTQVTDVPPDERTTLKVQLTQIKDALEKQIAELEELEDGAPLSPDTREEDDSGQHSERSEDSDARTRP